MSRIVFIDTEVDPQTEKVSDYGAVDFLRNKIHTSSAAEFVEFISGNKFICGHNILAHDLKYISEAAEKSGAEFAVDTLYLSPLLFPKRPYHALLKDDKLCTDELNNPLNDALKSMELFYDEVNAFENLDETFKDIFCGLLYPQKEFYGFFEYINRVPKGDTVKLIREKFDGKICGNCDIDTLSKSYPIELAYCLSIILTEDKYSIIPHWVHKNFPAAENVMRILRSTPCEKGCDYCDKELNVHKRLRACLVSSENNTNKSKREHLKRILKKSLAVFPKSAAFVKPAKRTFHDPTLWNNSKSMEFIAFNNFNCRT